MALAETRRLFVAIFPSALIVNKLRAVTTALAKQLPPQSIRWTHPEKLHLTVNFLGTTAAARIPEIQSALNAACKGHPRHEVQVTGLRAFPNRRRPQIIWAGLAGLLQPLENLKKSIDSHLENFEDRAFRPHLTLGRASPMNSAARKHLAQALDEHSDHNFGSWQIERVDLMQSDLSLQGAAYTTIESIVLESPL